MQLEDFKRLSNEHEHLKSQSEFAKKLNDDQVKSKDQIIKNLKIQIEDGNNLQTEALNQIQ